MFNALNSINPLGTSGFSLLKLLGGISKSLGIAREIIPIYKEIQPVVYKIPKLMERLNSLKFQNINFQNSLIEKNNSNKLKKTQNKQNSPVFFQ